MRKLVTIRTINEIKPIENADLIELAILDGWKVVINKNLYKVGDQVLYFEIDSWIPTKLAPFLSKDKEPSEFEGIKGERLRTVKLRGQVSQGLVLPLSLLDSYTIIDYDDLATTLGVVKYEKPEKFNSVISGKSFPSFIPKTDQERIQNLKSELIYWVDCGVIWEVTEKLDGSSMTVYVYDELEGVCSRNLDLERDENNRFWKAAINQRLIDSIRFSKRNLALQGELVGQGIQGNKYNLPNQKFYLYNIYDIDQGRYLSPEERLDLVIALDLETVPTLYPYERIKVTLDELISRADGESRLNPKAKREGLVYKSSCGNYAFKVISNAWLLKNE